MSYERGRVVMPMEHTADVAQKLIPFWEIESGAWPSERFLHLFQRQPCSVKDRLMHEHGGHGPKGQVMHTREKELCIWKVIKL